MNRTGRSLPAGPASTPQASSGWSWRAWATIASCSSRGMVSMITEVTVSGQGLHQRLLDRAEPGVHLVRGPLRVIRLQPAPLLLELLGDAQPDPEGEPDVVQRLQPRQGLILGELDAAAGLGQRVQHLLADLVLGAAQRGFGVLAELAGRLRIVGD